MMETITFEVSDGPDITFIGELAAQDSAQNLTTTIYNTQKGNWFVATINEKNKLIFHRIIEGKSVSALIDCLGYTEEAKRLYKQLGIDTTIHPDS